MADYEIKMDFSNLLMGMEQINEQLAGKIHVAIGMAAQKVYEQWADRVTKAPGIWHQERVAYVHSLKLEYTGTFSANVWTDYQIAAEIETGRPQRDLKRMLSTSAKTRISHAGKRYLIIPFRHNTPGNTAHARAMPTEIYKKVGHKDFKKTTVTSSKYMHVGCTIDGSASLIVGKRAYAYGNRLESGLAPKMKPHHATDIYAGMLRFDTSTGKKKSSAYLTFRVMSETQTNKWIVAAKPGQYIARQLAIDIQGDIEKVVRDSISES